MESPIKKRRQARRKRRLRSKSSGAALYLMLVLAALMSVQLMSTQVSRQHFLHETKRQHRLKFAKENLIALAANYMNNYGPTGSGPGHLPCANQKIPTSTRGSQGPDTPCSAEHFVIGRLPRLVGVEYQQRVLNYQPDEYDEENALWYVIAANFVNSPFRQLNTHSETNLTFNRQENVVAVVFDSGPANNTQQAMRPSAEFKDYLELDINQADVLTKDISNDRSLVIRLKDVMPQIAAQVSGRAADWVRHYHDNRCSTEETQLNCYPFAAQRADGVCSDGVLAGWLAVETGTCADALFDGETIEEVPSWSHWFNRNLWFEVVRYRIDETCLALNSDCEVNSGVVLVDGKVHPMISVAPKIDVLNK